MRAALVGSFPLEPSHFDGGVLTSTANLMEGLKSLPGLEIHLLTVDSSLRKPLDVERDGVLFHYLPSPGRLQTTTLYAADQIQLRRALSKIEPDIVHAQNAQNYGFICLRTGYPTVISIHGIVEEEARYIDSLKGRLRAALRSRLIQRYCLQKARHIIQPTRYPEQYFQHLKTGKWHDTGNAISEQFFNLEPGSVKGSILYSGAIIARKRLLDLVQAVAIVRRQDPNVRLRVAGGCPEPAYLEKVRAWIRGNDLEQNVEFLGLLTQAELIEEYRRCAFLALPSGQETSPMVIAEIMAVGKPVVATRVGGVPFLVDEGQTGFTVEIGDIQALADRISVLLASPARRIEMGAQARKKAEQNYRGPIVAARVREVYCEALNGA